VSSADTALVVDAAVPTRPVGFRGPILIGLALILVFFGGFGGWAALAPLDSAVIAPGSVIVDTNRKTIQHLEGGIVRQILVRNGDHVKAGQILVKLDDTQDRAMLQMVTSRYDTALALVARLTAEELDRATIDFPPELLARRSDPEVARLIDGQTSIFEARRNELASQVNVLHQQDAQLRQQIDGLKGQIKAQGVELGLLGEEIHTVQGLLAKGLAQKPHLLQLQREAADIDGQVSQNRAAIARAQEAIGETELRISELRTSRINDAAKEHADALKDLFEYTDRVRAARDVLARTAVTAPEDGTVFNLAVHTPGGVVKPGDALMDLVPSADRLVVELHIELKDISKVHLGLPAQVRLLAYSQRTTPSIEGKVTWVSADSIVDDKTGQGYYAGRVEIDQKELAELKDVRLYPGMPVEVMVETGTRTALDYLLAPINRTFARAMREN